MATDLLSPPPAGSLSDLSTRFDELAARIRRVALIKGLGRLAFVAAFLCAIGLLADWLWVMPPAVRGGWLLVVLAGTGYTLWTAVLKPVFRKLTIAELAAIVETKYPELGERLTSAVELTDPSIPEDEKGSPLMREWLESETLTSAGPLDFRKAVSTRRAKKAGWIGGIALAMLLAPFLLMTSGYTSLWGRLITPWAAHELPAELYFHVPEGDRVLPRGEDLTLLALPPESVPRDKLPAAVELAWTTPTGETACRPMQYNSEQKGFTVTLPHVFEGFEYIVTAERKRSERHTITVVDRPEITAFTLTITPPSYTGRPEKTVDGAVGNVTAFERSRIEAILEFNKPLASAEWLWQSAEENAPETPAALPFQLAEDRQSARLELLAAHGWFSARVQDEHGLSNIEEPARNLTIITDRLPDLALSGQIGTTRARRDDVIELHTRATDDFGVSALELHIETVNEQTEVQAVPPEELDSPEVEHVFPLDLAEIDLKDGESLKYRVRAADNRPVPGPQEVWSDERRIIIDPEAEPPGSREVAERQNELRDFLNQILEDLQDNRRDLKTLKITAETALNEEQPFEKQTELTNLELKQSQIGERLEKLAARFGGHRLFANLVPETQRIAREPVAKATEQLQKAQNQEDLAEKRGSIERSETAVAVAEADLQKLIERFDELAELERDLLVIPRLAGQAKRVADQAVELAEARDNPPSEESAEQKAAREQELDRKEAALKAEREQLTEALDELLKHRPEILSAARKSALEQIAELSQQAARLADRQDLLTESLKSDAEQAAKAAGPLAERQSELLKKADELKAKAPKPDDTTGQPPQVDAVDPEELRKILEDLKAGNLDSAAQRQSAVADRLEILAAELKKNQQLPTDPQKAAKKLAARQRELQSEILEAAKNRPDEDAPAREKEEFQGQLRKLAEKQTGIQAGIAELDAPAPHRQEHQKALDAARDAVEHLIQSDAEQAAEEAKNAADGLEGLAKAIGTLEERLEKAKQAVETLRKKQQDVGDDVAQLAVGQSEDENGKADRLIQRQQDITEDLVKIDAPQAEELLQEAVRESVAASSDLKIDRLHDAEASQDRAEQALADFAQKLAGKPTSREEVERLQKRQAEIRQKAETATKNQDRNSLAEQAAAQTEQAERLQKLDTPAAELERQTAESAAREATKALRDPGEKDQTGPALAQAANSLDQLQKTLTQKPETNPADAAEGLRKRQDQVARSAQAEAQNFKQDQTLPSPEDRKKQQDELARLNRDTKRLRAGCDATQQKQVALEALQKARESQEQLEALIKKKEQDDPAADAPPPNESQDDELQRLIQENAEQQKQAAEALDRFKQELANDETQETLHNEWNEIDEEAEKLVRENSSKPAQDAGQPITEEVEQLAREARALEQEIERLRQERREPRQVQVAQTEPSVESAPAEPGPPKSSDKPSGENQDPNPSRANDQQANDQDQRPSDPKDLEANDSERNPSDPNDSDPNDSERNPSDPTDSEANDSERNPSDPNDSDPNDSRAEQSPAPDVDQSPENNSPAPPDNENQTEQTDQIQENPQEPGDPSAAAPENPMAEESVSAANDPTANQQRAEQTEPSLAERQAELAGKSAELAVKIAREHGAESTASRRATEAARQAGRASEQAGDGALEQAAKSAKEAAETIKSAAEELAKAPAEPATGEASELAKEALDQAEVQTAIAEELEKAATNPTARRAARQAGQERLTEASKQLADRLDEAARELTSQPLNLEQPGEKTKAAGEAANQAAEQMKQAKNRAQAGDSGQAVRSSEQAAEALRRAAGEPPAPPENTPENTLVPGDLADQVAEARRRLEEAEKHLQDGQRSEQSPQTAGVEQSSSPRDGSEPTEAGENQQATHGETNSGQESNPADAKGQTGESQASQGQPNSGQAGQNPSGTQSAMAQSAQKFQQAAESLSRAARQLGSGNPPSQSESPGQSQNPSEVGEMGRPSGAGSRGGSNSPQSLQALEAELQRQNREVWGQLPGKLRTEILEGNKKPTGGDYARLIELYSQELLKKQQAE